MIYRVLVIVFGILFTPVIGFLLLKEYKRASLYILILLFSILLPFLFKNPYIPIVSTLFYFFALFYFILYVVKRVKNNNRFSLFKLGSISLLVTVLLITTTIYKDRLIFLTKSKSFYIPSNSMNNTLFRGDVVGAIRRKNIEYGDVAIFFINGNFYVKRAVALGGDEVIYYNNHLLLHPSKANIYPNLKRVTLLDREWIVDPYKSLGKKVIYKPKKSNSFILMMQRLDSIAMKVVFVRGLRAMVYKTGDFRANAFYYKVPKDRVFMMGDNRDNSYDSRFFGAINKNSIYGIAKVVYFNYLKFNRFNLLVN